MRGAGARGRGAAGPAEIAWQAGPGWGGRRRAFRPRYFHLRGIPDCAWWITGYDGLGMTQGRRTPLREKNHLSVQLLDAPCHGSIKPSSLAPLTSFPPKPFPPDLPPSSSSPLVSHHHLRHRHHFSHQPPTLVASPFFPLLAPITVVLPVLSFPAFDFHVPVLDFVRRRICSVTYHLRLLPPASS